MEMTNTKSIYNNVIQTFFLVVLNLVIIAIIGYMTLDSYANTNSRAGGLLLSFFMSFFIVYLTRNIHGMDRLVKFGSGMMAYVIVAVFKVGLSLSFTTGLLPCLVLGMAVLYYGNNLVKEISHSE